tara:strand:+ start:793 stop:969 length:177 start_codon:yes stop_codon:yes gene_type:complete
MIKRTGISVIAIIFMGSIFTSCSKHEICPAYTLEYKMEKIDAFKTTASNNQQTVSNSY